MKNTPSNTTGGLPEVKTNSAVLNLRTILEKTAVAHAQANPRNPSKHDVAFVNLLSEMSAEITKIFKGGKNGEEVLPKINKYIVKNTPDDLKETLTQAIAKANKKESMF